MICETSDNMRAMQRAVFDIPDPFLNPRVNCDALPGVDLDLWKERVTCKGGWVEAAEIQWKSLSPDLETS